MADIELLPLVGTLAFFLPEHHREVVQSYARANVEHHTEKLREEVDKLTRANAALTHLWESASKGLDQAEARAWGLEDALRGAIVDLRKHQHAAAAGRWSHKLKEITGRGVQVEPSRGVGDG